MKTQILVLSLLAVSSIANAQYNRDNRDNRDGRNNNNSNNYDRDQPDYRVNKEGQKYYWDNESNDFDCMIKPNKGDKVWANCKEARGSEHKKGLAQYLLDTRGNLYAYMPNLDQDRCQITNNVKDFKIAVHKDDQAVMYFVQGNDLHVMNSKNFNRYYNCPETEHHSIQDNIAYTIINKRDGTTDRDYKYNVVNKNTTIFNVALSQSGHLMAFGPNKVVYEAYNIADFALNGNFDRDNKPFKKYVLFTLNNNHRINKIMVETSNFFGFQFKDETAVRDNGYYSSIDDFKVKVGLIKGN